MPGRTDHFDLMLESHRKLLTWELPQTLGAAKVLSGKRIADHRMEYLEFEGDISGQRGSVSRIASGSLDWILRSDNLFECQLKGELNGRLRLDLETAETHDSNAREMNDWRLEWRGEEI